VKSFSILMTIRRINNLSVAGLKFVKIRMSLTDLVKIFFKMKSLESASQLMITILRCIFFQSKVILNFKSNL
jgi:hypothetical protein